MNEDLGGRLYNWKFDQATRYLEGEPASLQHTVTVLARLFGDSGWFGGDMGLLVNVVVESLGVPGRDWFGT